MLDLINKGVKIEIQVIPDQQCYDCEEILKND